MIFWKLIVSRRNTLCALTEPFYWLKMLLKIGVLPRITWLEMVGVIRFIIYTQDLINFALVCNCLGGQHYIITISPNYCTSCLASFTFIPFFIKNWTAWSSGISPIFINSVDLFVVVDINFSIGMIESLLLINIILAIISFAKSE